MLKWRIIKIIMKGELDAMNVKRQKMITKNDWIVAAIKGLEKKYNIHRDPSIDFYYLQSSPYSKKNADKFSDDVMNSAGSINGSKLKKSMSYGSKLDNFALFKIEKLNHAGKTMYLTHGGLNGCFEYHL